MIELNFTEVEPLGPQLAGDRNEFQVHEAWGRRFAAEFTGDQTYWAVVEVTFFQENLAGGGLVLTREDEYTICTDLRDIGTSEEWADADYAEQAPGEVLDEQMAKRACTQVSLDEIAWPEKHANKIEIWQQI